MKRHMFRKASEPKLRWFPTRSALPDRQLRSTIWEPTRLEGEDREGWLERFHQMRPDWAAISDEEFAAFESHCRASDYAETAATWIGMARDAGFRTADELMTVPNQLARVYRFRH